MSLTPYTPGNIPLYRFFVTYDALEYEVFPLNFLESSLVYEKQSGQVFYRTKFSGPLIFGTDSFAVDELGATQNRMDDYDLFWGIEAIDPCETIEFKIERTVGGVMATYWEGIFSTSDGTFDVDKCTFEVTPLPNDCYTIFIDKGDVEYNMIDMPAIDVPLYEVSMTDAGTTWTYTRNRLVLDVLKYIIDDISGGASTVTSTFFEDATNPVTLADNRMNYVTIAQKSDIKRPTATEGATVAMVSFNSLMQMLKCLNLYWDFDGSDVIVEHISYFPATPGGIDLRDHELATASNKYSYLKEEMPKYEKFSWMEADINFTAFFDIWYDSNCVSSNAESNYTKLSINATTDIEYINECMADPDREGEISDDGFVLLCNYEDGGNYYIQLAETGKAPAPGYPVRFNGDFSWRALHEFYFRHDRVLIEGYMNNILETFYTAKKTKKQDVSIIVCETFDPTEEITSELGEIHFGGAKAIVQKAELEPSGLLKLTLLYGPDDNANAGNAPSQSMRVVEVSTGATQTTYYFTLTEPADAALVGNQPTIEFDCEDAGANTCTTGPTPAIFGLGDRTYTLVVDWNDACGAPWVGPPVCIVDPTKTVDPGAWANYELIRDDTTAC